MFAELVEWSILTNKIEVDNSGAIDDTLADFVAKMEPYLTELDRTRIGQI